MCISPSGYSRYYNNFFSLLQEISSLLKPVLLPMNPWNHANGYMFPFYRNINRSLSLSDTYSAAHCKLYM